MLKTLAKLIFGIAAIAAATSFGTSTSRAYGDAPWCAVITIVTGTVYWDCQYPTFEACYHLGNILAGNKGFCNVRRPSMTDYRSIISSVVSRLPSTTDRQPIYEQARTALHKRLGNDPQISDAELVNEHY